MAFDPFAAVGAVATAPPAPDASAPAAPQPQGPAQFPVVEPHATPDGSGGMTNLSDEDWYKFKAGQTGPTQAAAPAPTQKEAPPQGGKSGKPFDPFAAVGAVQAPANGAPPAAQQQAPAQPQSQPPSPTQPQPPATAPQTPPTAPGQPGFIESLASALHGIPRGLVGGKTTDYADAAMQTPLRMITGWQGPGAAFQEGLTSAEAANHRADQAPIASIGGELMGGAAGGLMAAPALGWNAAAGLIPKAGAIGSYLGRNAAFGGLMSYLSGGDPTTGAAIGAAIPGAHVLGSAALAPAKGVISKFAPLVSKSARERSVGRTLNQAMNGSTVQTSKVGPLDMAQATNNPEIAARVDLAPSYNATANANLRAAQQEAIANQIGKIGAPASQADASAAFTNSVRQARGVAGTEESRLWTVPELAQTKITVSPVQTAVHSAMTTIDPALRSAMSPELKALVNRLNTTPNTTVRDLNGIRSEFERIARNPMTDGAQRSIARTLSGAFLDGMDKVPEIAGQAATAAAPAAAAATSAAAPTAQNMVDFLASKGGNAALVKTTRTRKPESLVEFLISKGGVQDQGGDLSSIGADAIHHRAAGRLVNARGLSPDYAREAAEEAGFLRPNSDVSDLYDAIGDHISGRPVYRMSEQAEGQLAQQADREMGAQEHRIEGARTGVLMTARQMDAKLTKDEIERASHMVAAGEHPEEAIRQAVWPTEDRALQNNVQHQAFTSPGMAGAVQAPLDIGGAAAQEAIPPNPAIGEAYRTAREYTKQMRGMFGQPDAAALTAKNSNGAFRVDPSEGARRFFNFSNGSPEGPQTITQLSDFVAGLKQPGAGAVSAQMKDTARSYVASSLVKAARAGEGQNFNPKTMQDFLRQNGGWMQTSGLFDKAQIQAAKDLIDYAGMLRRPEQLLRQVNSATQSRAARQATFVDEIMSPWVRRIISLGGMAAGGHQHGVLGAGAGMMGGAAFEGAVGHAQETMREIMAEALLNPKVAQELRMKASAGNLKLMSPATRNLIESARVAVGTDLTQMNARLQQPAISESR